MQWVVRPRSIAAAALLAALAAAGCGDKANGQPEALAEQLCMPTDPSQRAMAVSHDGLRAAYVSCEGPTEGHVWVLDLAGESRAGADRSGRDRLCGRVLARRQARALRRWRLLVHSHSRCLRRSGHRIGRQRGCLADSSRCEHVGAPSAFGRDRPCYPGRASSLQALNQLEHARVGRHALQKGLSEVWRRGRLSLGLDAPVSLEQGRTCVFGLPVGSTGLRVAEA